ncbi:MAG: two-component regulator propeller domain-containing protein [Chloroflexota bacterium]
MNYRISALRIVSTICILALSLAQEKPGPAAGAANTPAPYAPNSPLRFDSLSIEQGLSQSTVEAIYQDKQGYLWFGTQDGLNLYDGRRFTIFRPELNNPNSLTSRYILALAGDPAGNLWIGTLGGGLNHYNRQTGRFTSYWHNPHNPDSLGGDSVLALVLAANGSLWIGSNGGLDVLDPQSGKYIAHYRHRPAEPDSLLSNQVNDLVEDPDGFLWIATGKGLDRLDPSRGTFTHFVYKEDDSSSLMSEEVSALALGGDGALWLATPVGIERLDRRTLALEPFTVDPYKPTGLSGAPTAILEDSTGNVWVGTNDGLNLLDRRSGQFTRYRKKDSEPNSLSASIIETLYEDRENILWIGTFGGGVDKLDRGRNKFPLLQYDLADPKNIPCFGILEAQDGALWFAMFGTGLLRLDRETGAYTLYRSNPGDPKNSLLDDYPYALRQGRDGRLWIGSRTGLSALDTQSGQFTHYTIDIDNPSAPTSLRGRFVNYIFEDSQGFVWVALRAGLERLDPTTDSFTHYIYNPKNPAGLSSSSVSTVFESRSGAMWIGYYESGLSRFDRTQGTFTHYHHSAEDPNSLNSNTIHAIHEDRDGILWFATAYGLDRFDPQAETFTHYTSKDGLPSDVVYTLLEDAQGNYWLGTNYGLARFDPRSGSIVGYDFNDGLQSNEFNVYAAAKTREGDLIFGGIAGANIFRPEQIQYNLYVPPIVVTALTQGGEAIHRDRPAHTQTEITLRWPHNYFEFEFAALSYADARQNRYAYRLETFDNGWIDSGKLNYGRYTNLPGGRYTLHIKGSNNDGVWNESGASIQVTVVPAFWQTWWFRGGSLLSIAMGIALVYRLRVRSMKTRTHELERQVEARAREIQALFEQTKELAIIEERNRLARDLHDSAKQKAFAALAQLGVVRRLLHRSPETAQKHVEEVENLVYEVIQELSFLIQEMYPLALEEKGLITILREYVYEWENRNDIRVSLQVENQRRLPLQVEQALYRIVQESLANIARHSHASQVNICLAYGEKTVALSVDDNGQGFDLQQKPSGVGLRSMQERAALIGGEMAIQSAPGSGTRIQVLTPLSGAK